MGRAKTEESMQGTTLPKVYNGENKPSVTFLQPRYAGMLITQFYPLPSNCISTKKK